MARSRRRTASIGKIRSASRTAPPPARAPDLVVLGLAGLGMAITLYLTALALWGEAALFCAEGSGCDVIRQSRWSTVLGLPVALWGFAVYAAIGAVAFTLPPTLKRWRRLWFLAMTGVLVSLYLTVVGIVSVDAVCAWCLASLATIIALLVAVGVRRPASAPGKPLGTWALHNGVLAVVVLGALHLYYEGMPAPRENPRLMALAEHLRETGVVYYGAYWCPNCQRQGQLFGSSEHRLPYVECTPQGRSGPVSDECLAARVRAYPTWIIDGRRIEGVLVPEDLARQSGFDWEGFRGGAG